MTKSLEEIEKQVSDLVITGVESSYYGPSVMDSEDLLLKSIDELCKENERLKKQNAILECFLKASYHNDFEIYFYDDSVICFGQGFQEIEINDEKYDWRDATEDYARDIISKIKIPAGYELQGLEVEHDYVTASFDREDTELTSSCKNCNY